MAGIRTRHGYLHRLFHPAGLSTHLSTVCSVQSCSFPAISVCSGTSVALRFRHLPLPGASLASVPRDHPVWALVLQCPLPDSVRTVSTARECQDIMRTLCKSGSSLFLAGWLVGSEALRALRPCSRRCCNRRWCRVGPGSCSVYGTQLPRPRSYVCFPLAVGCCCPHAANAELTVEGLPAGGGVCTLCRPQGLLAWTPISGSVNRQ